MLAVLFLQQLMEKKLQRKYDLKILNCFLAYIFIILSLIMDYIALLVVLLLLYLIVILVLRLNLFKSRIINKTHINCCPTCYFPLDKLKSNKYEKIYNFFTLNVFDFKKFFCSSCGWSGFLAKYTKKSKKR